MVAGADHGDVFSRDMGYSETEFFRILPSALHGYRHEVRGSSIVVFGPREGQRVTLSVTPQPDRRIAMISIPRIRVDFSFHNYSGQERQDFMIQFDRSYQRGGG